MDYLKDKEKTKVLWESFKSLAFSYQFHTHKVMEDSKSSFDISYNEKLKYLIV